MTIYPYYVLLLRFLPSLILLGFSSNCVHKSISSPIFYKFNCSDATLPKNNTYISNLSNLFSSLASKTTLNNDTTGLFSDITVSLDGNSNSTVYGQYLCQGDYTVDECKSCVSNAATRLAIRCPTSASGYIWYKGCTLSFSNVTFQFNNVYSLPSNLVWLKERNTNRTAANGTSLMAAFIVTTMRILAKQVANVDNDVDEIQSSSLGSKYFGTKTVNFTIPGRVNTTLYEMVQCIPDLSARDCDTCLTWAINELGKYGKGTIGGRVGIRSCFIRYETYLFYRLTQDMDLFPYPLKESNIAGIAFAITLPVSIVLAIGMVGVGLCAKKAISKKALIYEAGDGDFDVIESYQYQLSDVKVATDNFSDDNKIGQGGFGSVYKGVLQSGQIIAVKKLFLRLGQIEEEFKNEVEVVAKLQHRNLVRLLGYCLARDAKLLVFEYVPNKSLDKVLFVSEERVQLDWLMRFKIIVGIARGLLYLHEESRLRIVHRDLKPGNILLDEEMNPKIADFGLARIFGLKQPIGEATNTNTMQSHGVDPTHQSTRRGGGTPGYMAPECAERKQFSVKTDVYSFGVLILEIISGKRNSRFYQTGLADDLISYAWMKWEAGTALELMDDALRSSRTSSNKHVHSWTKWEVEAALEMMDIPLRSSRTSVNEDMNEQALTCIHLGLLCVQRDAKARPTMGTIVHKLNYPSDNSLPSPEQPAAFNSTSLFSSSSSSSSLNECSFSDLDVPR